MTTSTLFMSTAMEQGLVLGLHPLLFLATAAHLGLATYLWPRRRVPGAGYFGVAAVLSALWPLSTALDLWTSSAPLKMALHVVQSLLPQYAALLWLAAVAEITGRQGMLSRRRWMLLSLPFVGAALMWLLGPLPLWQSGFEVRQVETLWVMSTQNGPLYILFTLYTLGLVVWTLRLAWSGGPRPLLPAQRWAVFGGTLLPVLAGVYSRFGGELLPGVEPTPLVSGVTSLWVVWAFWRYRQFEPSPVARDAVLERIDDPVLVIGPTGLVVDFNPAAGHLLAGQGTLLRQAVRELLGPQTWPGLQDALEQPSTLEQRFDIHTQHDPPRAYEVRLLPLHDPRQRWAGRVLWLHDISERRALEQMRESFLATVSHELRTPVTAISGALNLLEHQAGSHDPLEQELLGIAQQNSERLLSLIGDLLDLQKLERAGLRHDFAPTALRPLLERAVHELGPYAERLKVHLHLEPGSSPQARADAGRLSQVLHNLISNACKFSPPGGEVCLRLLERDGQVRVEVQDEGSGIPEGFRAQVFQKFAQAPSAIGRSVPRGSGLGLALCKAIVEQHGGQIGFEALAVGTRFWFEVPLEPSLAPVQRDQGAGAGDTLEARANLGT